MNRVLCFFAALIMALPLWAYSYKVNVSSTLNMRSEPNSTSQVLMKLPKGAIVECSVDLNTIQDTWVLVEYQGEKGFLKSEFLAPVETKQTNSTGTSFYTKQWYQLLDWEGDGYRWMAYLIGGLCLLMWFECKFIRSLPFGSFSEREGDCKKWALPNGILLMITSVIILVYIYLMGSNSLWFFYPSVIHSWFFVVVNFVFFTYILIDLCAFFFMAIDDVADSYDISVNIYFGLFAWVLGVTALVICGFIGFEPTYIYVIEAICQGIQVLIILYQLGSKGHILAAFGTAILYVISSLAIMTLVSCMVFLVIILIIVSIVLAFSLFIARAPGGVLSDKDGEPNSNGVFTADGEYEIINSEGKSTRMRHSSGSIYQGDDGHQYNRVGNNFERTN